jgi:hypothetical protein
MIEEGAQDFIKTVGEEGCYALTLCKIAEISSIGFDVLEAIEYGIRKGYIADDMTVKDGAALLTDITKRKWTVEWQPARHQSKEGDFLVAEWYNKGTRLTHFTLEYPEKWNSLKNSVTVKEGAIRSYRVYRVAK